MKLILSVFIFKITDESIHQTQWVDLPVCFILFLEQKGILINCFLGNIN